MTTEAVVDDNVAQKSNIVLVGRPFVPIGIGEHIRCSFRSFQFIGADVGLRDVYGEEIRDLYGAEIDPDFKSELQKNLVPGLSRDINIFNTNGDEVDLTLLNLREDLPSDAYNVIYPAWELSRYPAEWAKQLDRFDEIWAPSKFTYASIAAAVTKPVVHMPLAGQIHLKTFLGRHHFQIPESSFTFLFFFDLTSYIERKNPFAALEAFERVCKLRPDDDLCLVIKFKGGEMKGEHQDIFSDYVARLKGRLVIIDKLLTDNEIKNLVRCCDCFLSLHRSEGFGLGLITAMFLGKPVVATAYSANLDFMNESNSCLVRYELCAVPNGAYPFGEGQVWADPKIDDAVEHMLKLVSDRDFARSIGQEASRHIRVNFSYRATGLRYSDRIKEIAAIRSTGRVEERHTTAVKTTEQMISDYDAVLSGINSRLSETPPDQIPQLLSPLPLAVWGDLLLEIPAKYANLKALFPSMPSEATQIHWTGNHGAMLLSQSIAFVESLVNGYQALTRRSLERARVLDFGCGWGRIIRLLYKYVGYENIFAVDAWDEPIALCKRHGVKAHFAFLEDVPTTLPFDGEFDLIYALSVFTHLSEKTTRAAFDTLRRFIADDGIFLITIRPKEYWQVHGEAVADRMMAQHDETGFAFLPSNRPPIDGDVTYGDTSMSVDYIAAKFPRWQVVNQHCNLIDPYQLLLFLRPA